MNSLLEPGLLENALDRSSRHIEAQPPRDRDCTPFFRMPELAMAAAGSDEDPTIGFNDSENLVDLHASPK